MLLLMGPFVDAKHPVVAEGTLSKTYEDQWLEVLERIVQRVVMVVPYTHAHISIFSHSHTFIHFHSSSCTTCTIFTHSHTHTHTHCSFSSSLDFSSLPVDFCPQVAHNRSVAVGKAIQKLVLMPSLLDMHHPSVFPQFPLVVEQVVKVSVLVKV